MIAIWLKLLSNCIQHISPTKIKARLVYMRQVSETKLMYGTINGIVTNRKILLDLEA